MPEGEVESFVLEERPKNRADNGGNNAPSPKKEKEQFTYTEPWEEEKNIPATGATEKNNRHPSTHRQTTRCPHCGRCTCPRCQARYRCHSVEQGGAPCRNCCPHCKLHLWR